MTQDTTDGDDDGRLQQFERNRYFHGKLMTARDMQLEQEYHRDRLDTLTQHVVGSGIVCGLETTVTEEDGTLEVTVQPGLAFDSHGRAVVVAGPTPTTEEIDLSSVADEMSLYLEYDNCVTETVPIPGSEDACEEECTYNRIREIAEITHEPEPPAEQKTVRHVAFPSSADFDLPEGEAQPAPSHDELHRAARSYYTDADGALRDCGTGEDGSVFLGYFTTDGEGTWTRETDAEPRPHVFTNDMLYAAITRHAADFGNPHEVELAVRDSEPGAVVKVLDSASPEGDVDLRSPGETVAIGGDAGSKRVDLDVADRLLDRIDELETRLDRHDRYALERSLWCTCRSFSALATQFDLAVADEIATRAKTAVSEGVYEDIETYVDLLVGSGEERGLLALEREVSERLAERDSVEGLDQYEAAVSRLETVLEEEASALETARAQDRVCNAAACLEGDQRAEVDLEASLRTKEQAYAEVVDRFDSEAAQQIVQQVSEALEGGVHEEDASYREFLESLVTSEKSVLNELQDRITTESGRRYAAAASDLTAALEDEVPIGELATAQNDLSRAARQLEEGEGIRVESSINPENYSVDELRDAVTGIRDSTELENVLLAEFIGENRITAERTIRNQLDTIGR